ncbi:metallophosphoesterase [Nocardioides albus]|uniref:3',5'-cyclic AMP phosphodiesterase CpdA n=1 Tax=Nocardioides albus TaxID=1841 RepID=A0A7W5F8T5_9ACTN|nr:metallophosphoesterase [Nocardioides albus]MBB3089411.1 3',5'-cyclic AMP phosphodiesterase CpdA [Nocardioides albus]GGU12218.1 phosphohydrolase [Nocardioides albus]
MTRILHLSDIHVSAGGPDMDGVDAVAALEGILRDARHVPGLDAVVVSGDIADDGSAEGCRSVLDRVGAFAAERGIPHIYSTGNHDARGPFREVLGSGHRDPDGSDRGRLLHPDSDLCAAVSFLGELRIVTVDSLVPGKPHGFLDEHQLACLTEELATPTRDGTILVLHHPPLHLASLPWVADVVLQNISTLGRVVRSSDVRVILAGHLHFQASGFLAGVPVWVTPGVVTRIDTTAPPHLVRGVLGAGASVVDLVDPASPAFHVISARDPRAGEQIYLYDAASGEDIAEEG